MNFQAVAGSFEHQKKVENRNLVGCVDNVTADFYFKALLSTVDLELVVSAATAAAITKAVCAKIHGL